MRWRLELTLRDVWDGLRTQGSRLMVASVAIMLGIAALVTLFALLSGLQVKAEKLQLELGLNVFGILNSISGKPGADQLEDRHARALAGNLECCLVTTVRRYEVPSSDTHGTLSIVATDNRLSEVRQWQMVAGRFLDRWDLVDRRTSVVISRQLNEAGVGQVGDTLIIRNVPFRIVGIVELTHDLDLASEIPDLGLGNRLAFVPRTIAPYVLEGPPAATAGSTAGSARRQDLHIDGIFVKAPGGEDIGPVVAATKRLLSQPDLRAGAISYVTPDSVIHGIKKMQRIIVLTAGSVSALCLVLGGATLLALMAINVKERVAEIGLRRTLGASHREIILLFVLEACMVTGGVAALATFGTYLILALARSYLPVPVEFTAMGFLTPMVVAILLGILFSYAPAVTAARLAPAEALRAE